MFRVYLAGSMAGRVAEIVRAERQLAVKQFAKAGIHAIDPGASEKNLWKSGKNSKISHAAPLKIMEAFVRQDLWLIRRVDALVVLTGDYASDGTWNEIAYARTIGLPVVMIAPSRVRGDLVGWSNVLNPYIVEDLTSAIRLVKRKLVPDYEDHINYFNRAIKNPKQSLTKKSKSERKAKARKITVKISK